MIRISNKDRVEMKKKNKVLKFPDKCSVCKTKIDKDSVGHTDSDMTFTCENCFIKLMK